MAKVNDGGPAFPKLQEFDGNNNPMPDGMSLRDVFAVHAPSEPQAWFTPTMKEDRPVPVKLNGVIVDSDDPVFDAKCANIKEVREFDKEYAKQTSIQWPYAWADAQIAERERINDDKQGSDSVGGGDI